MEHSSIYPQFNVMNEAEHWDPHTRQIVEKRLKTESFYPYQIFTPQQAKMLSELCKVLLNDDRYPIISYVVHHIDSALKSDIGESQRKLGVPKQKDLLINGINELQQYCEDHFKRIFSDLDTDEKTQLVHDWFIDRPDFLNKIHTDAVASYYSHPTIWSEIGYAGPAYPRGYVRSELGLTDPWEATRNE